MTFHAARRALELRRAIVRQRLGLNPVPASNGPGDQGDTAAESSERVVVFASREQLTVHLREIEEALDRVATGRWGRCTTCTEPIAAARLRVYPEKEHCVACARAREEQAAATDRVVRVRIADDEEPEDEEPAPSIPAERPLSEAADII